MSFNNHAFLLGAAKCGTTSLAKWLSLQPNICFSNPKEPKYWTMYYHEGLDWHWNTSFWHYNKEKVTMEGRPMNFHVHFVAKRIYETFPGAKLIVILRNPIERAYSGWYHFANMRPGREILSFEEAIEDNLLHIRPDLFKSEYEYMKQADPMGGCYETTYVEVGFYNHHIARYVDLFGSDSVKIVFFEDLTDPSDLVNRCCRFLGINFVESHEYPMLKISRKPALYRKIKAQHPVICEKLAALYSQDLNSLSQRVGFDVREMWEI